MAAGQFSLAAGVRAEAMHEGSFVWADASGYHLSPTIVPFRSESTIEFAVRAVGGVRFVTTINGNGVPTAGVALSGGSGTWETLSDRHAKENVVPVNPLEVLEKLSALPLATWNYKSQEKSIRHLGPMAQDFHAAFGLGGSERTIATVDADGVALAAVKGLNEKMEAENEKLRAELRSRDASLAEMQRRLGEIEGMLKMVGAREP